MRSFACTRVRSACPKRRTSFAASKKNKGSRVLGAEGLRLSLLHGSALLSRLAPDIGRRGRRLSAVFIPADGLGDDLGRFDEHAAKEPNAKDHEEIGRAHV